MQAISSRHATREGCLFGYRRAAALESAQMVHLLENRDHRSKLDTITGFDLCTITYSNGGCCTSQGTLRAFLVTLLVKTTYYHHRCEIS
jgi:hypothetical protein